MQPQCNRNATAVPQQYNRATAVQPPCHNNATAVQPQCNRQAREAYVGSLQSAQAETPAADGRVELPALLASLEGGEAAPRSVDLSSSKHFRWLTKEQRSGTLRKLAALLGGGGGSGGGGGGGGGGDSGVVTWIRLDGLDIDDGNGDDVVNLILALPSLERLSLERNCLGEGALLRLAGAIEGHPSMCDLAVANQRSPLSTASICALLDAMEATPSLVRLALGTVRDGELRARFERISVANREAARRAGRPSTASTPERPTQLRRSSADAARVRATRGESRFGGESAGALQGAADAVAGALERRWRSAQDAREVSWEREAHAIASDAPFAYGVAIEDEGGGGQGAPRGQAARAVPPSARYVLTGSMLWGRARAGERLALVLAFRCSTRVVAVEMANCGLSDDLGAAWGRVLQHNTAITALNLETNAIASAGVEAVAAALRVNSTLRVLKMANQRAAASWAAEEALAAALETNGTILKLTVDVRNIRVRDVLERTLRANVDQQRRLRVDSQLGDSARRDGRSPSEIGSPSEERVVRDARASPSPVGTGAARGADAFGAAVKAGGGARAGGGGDVPVESPPSAPSSLPVPKAMAWLSRMQQPVATQPSDRNAPQPDAHDSSVPAEANELVHAGPALEHAALTRPRKSRSRRSSSAVATQPQAASRPPQQARSAAKTAVVDGQAEILSALSPSAPEFHQPQLASPASAADQSKWAVVRSHPKLALNPEAPEFRPGGMGGGPRGAGS